MKSICSLLLLICAALSPGGAESLSHYIPDSHLLYFETRDIPGYKTRMAESPLARIQADVDWTEFILRMIELGRADREMSGEEEETPAPSPEDLRALLDRMEGNWRDISSHFSGDSAFTVGGLEPVVNTFRQNKPLRAELQQTDGGWTDEEGDTETKVRLAQAAELDAAELNSILSRFSLWIEIENSAGLETKLKSLIDELLQQQSVNPLERQQLTDGDHTIHALTPALSERRTGLYWAFHRDLWLITLNEQTLREHLTHLDAPPDNSLAAHADFKDALEYVGTSDTFLYFDPARIDTLLRDSLPDTPAAPSPAGLPRAESILNWLAPDALLPIVSGSQLEADGISFKSRMGFKRETALSRILIDPNPAPAPVPAFLYRDFYQITTTHWHIGDGWTRLEKELVTLVPQAAAGMGMVRMLATSQLGFDLKLQFFDHLDSGLVFVQSLDSEVIKAFADAGQSEDPAAVVKVSMEHPTGGQNFLIGLQLRNKAAIEEAMERLMNRTHPQGPPEPEVVAGTPVRYPVPASVQGGTFRKAASFAITDDYLLIGIGSPELLKSALRAQADEGLQLRNQPAFTELRSRFPREAGTLEYSTAQLLRESLRMMEVSLSMLKKDFPDVQLPDLQKLADIMDRSLGVMVRKGLVFETDSLLKFPE